MKFACMAALALLSATSASAQAQAFDAHVHLHDGEASIREYRAQSEASGHQVADFAAMWFGGRNQAPAGHPEEMRANNDALIALARRHAEMMPVATVHPYDGASAIAELERVASEGVNVLKVHPLTQGFDVTDPRVLTLAKRAGDLGVIVLIDNASIVPGDNEKLLTLALSSPGTTFILAHMGGLNFRFWNTIALARTAERTFGANVYFDISALVTIAAGSPIEDEFIWTIRNVGIDRVLLGSDFPQISLQQTLEAFDRLDLSEEEKAKIRSQNAQLLFASGRTPLN